jgi:hypothetical protein
MCQSSMPASCFVQGGVDSRITGLLVSKGIGYANRVASYDVKNVSDPTTFHTKPKSIFPLMESSVTGCIQR